MFEKKGKRKKSNEAKKSKVPYPMYHLLQCIYFGNLYKSKVLLVIFLEYQDKEILVEVEFFHL